MLIKQTPPSCEASDRSVKSVPVAEDTNGEVSQGLGQL